VVQAVSFVLIRNTIDDNARASVQESMTAGEQVFMRLLNHNADHLLESTRALASDYGFRAAVSSNDRATVTAALLGHSERLGAQVAVFTDAQLHLKASTTAQADQMLPLLPALVATGPVQDPTPEHHVMQVDGEPFQIVAVPVKTPQIIGWVVMGFKLDGHLLADIRQLTGLRVAMLTRSAKAPWHLALSALKPAQSEALRLQWTAALADSLRQANGRVRFQFPDGDHVGRLVQLESDSGEQTVAVLLRSLDEAVEPYQQLQIGILVLSVFGVMLFALGSVLTARHITTPITTLTKLARHLARGNYDAPVPSHGDDEIGELADAFESMRQAVHDREDEIRRQAFSDSLTRLPNRAQFNVDLHSCVSRAADTNSQGGEQHCAVLKLDLDRFQHVNDVLGHETGDQLLQCVADLLKGLMPETGSTVARLSGDEFAVLLHTGDLADALALARRIQSAFETPIVLGEQTVDVSAGIGIAVYPDHALDAMTLKRRADMALRKAKSEQTGIAVFDPALDVRSKQALSLLGELRQAIEHDQLRLYLQPKVSLITGEVTGAEALLRWQHPTRGLLPPAQFIPFAEQTGFIRHITAWLLEASARASCEWSNAELPFSMAVNLSTRDLIDHELPAKLTAVLARHRVPPRCLCLEITESSIMDDPQRALQTLDQLHQMGLKLAIDDFGTGYSSLAYLKRLPVDELKIDKSFVMNMQRDEQDAKIVRSTIDLAHNLGLQVVAEGLEDEQAWPLLKALSCDQAQGYWIAKPMPAADFMAWAAQWVSPKVDKPFAPRDATVA
jgi:diguanylate cyclase (GGDEF)-like protein